MFELLGEKENMNKIENAEYFSYLKKFIDGRLDIHTFVQKCYLNDICDRIYEVLFEEIYEKTNPILKDFVDIGVELYYLLNNLNKQLNIHHWYENYDVLLIRYISGRIVKTFADNDRMKNIDELRMYDEILARLENNKTNPTLIDAIIDHILNEFKNENMLNIKKESDYSAVISTKEVSFVEGWSFSRYLRYLIMDKRGLKQNQAARRCKISESILSMNLDDYTSLTQKSKLITKNSLYKIILGLHLDRDEYSALLSYARKEVSGTKESNRYDIDMNNPRDNLIMSFIDYPFRDENIIDTVNKRLKEKDMDDLET